MNFQSLSAPIGAGKTNAILHYTGHGAQAGERFIIAQPTTDLIDQCHPRLATYNIRSTAIHSKLDVGNVAIALRERTLASSGGETIFCTHSGLMQTTSLPKKDQFHLIVDEIPDTIWNSEFVLSKNASILLSMLSATPANENYSKLAVIDHDLLDRIAHDAGLQGIYSKQTQDLTRKLRSGSWDVYVLTTQWTKFLSENRIAKGKLLMFGLLRPSMFTGFSSTTFVTANLENTIAYQQFRNQGAVFSTHKQMTSHLTYTEHTNGEHLTIYYAVDGDWSKKVRDTKVADGSSVNDVIVQAAIRLFGTEPFFKLINKDLWKNDPFERAGIMLPHKAHGRNDFRGLHNCVIIPALSPPPSFYKFLQEMAGLDPAFVKRAIYLEQIYQGVGRGSPRVADDTNPKKVVVPDIIAAQFLVDMFPGAKMMQLPGTEQILPPTRAGRPKIYATEEDMKIAKKLQTQMAMQRTRWKCEQKLLLDNRYSGSHSSPEIQSLESAPSTTPAPQAEANPGFVDSYWRKVQTKFWENQRYLTTKQMFTLLRSRFESNEYTSKEHAPLWSTVWYKEVGKGHSIDNASHEQGIILDIDHAVMTPQEAADILKEVQMMIVSSWSHKPDDQRYRVIMPTTTPMSLETSKAIRKMIVNRFEKAGFVSQDKEGRRHGVDVGKLHSQAGALFYLPCRRPGGFLYEHSDEGRAPIDPEQWIDACPPHIVDWIIGYQEPTEVIETAPIEGYSARQMDKFEEAKSEWRSHTKANGNAKFHRLGWRLHGYGMALNDIEQALKDEANHAHRGSKDDRVKQVPYILKDIKTRGHRST